jgi:putative FmdB family regulatory protein
VLDNEAMPFYEFRCNKCHKKFSLSLSISRYQKGVSCPSCKSKDVEQQFTSVSVVTARKS